MKKLTKLQDFLEKPESGLDSHSEDQGTCEGNYKEGKERYPMQKCGRIMKREIKGQFTNEQGLQGFCIPSVSKNDCMEEKDKLPEQESGRVVKGRRI